MDRRQIEHLLTHKIDHIGYSVPDIKTAINHWATTFGVGPFLVMEQVKYDLASYHGKPCIFESSAAFAKWGDIFLELQQIQTASPDPVASLLRFNSGYVVNHVGYVTSEPERESARLAAIGMPAVVRFQFGPLVTSIHDAPFLGHAIEINTASELLDDLRAQASEVADQWDGIDPIRMVPVSPMS